MKNCKINFRKNTLLSLIVFSLLSISALATSYEKEKSIQQLLEDQSPSISFSFSKNIVDFFDTDLDWKNGKKHIEGDFSKAAFFAFDENTTNKTLNALFENQGYTLMRVDDEDTENDEVLMFVNRTGKEVEEAHFIIQNDEKLIVFSLYGKMRLKELK